VEVKELPQTLQSALRQIGYRKADIRVVPATEVYTGSAGMSGRRAFTMAVNIATGQTSQVAQGSWGGPNPFERKPADDLETKVKIPQNSAIIKGSGGEWSDVGDHLRQPVDVGSDASWWFWSQRSRGEDPWDDALQVRVQEGVAREKQGDP